ncbi:glycosyltransferase [Niabella aquatica]
MAIILDADEWLSETYCGYLQEHLFRALAALLPRETLLFPQTEEAVAYPPHIQGVVFPPKTGVFLRRKTEKWLQRVNATAFISFKRTLKYATDIQQVVIIATEAQLNDTAAILSAGAIGVTSKYLYAAFEKKYPQQAQKGFLAEGVIAPLPLPRDCDFHDIKNVLTEEKEYFICADFNMDKERLVTLLKGFSAFKKRLQSNWKLVIVLRSAESIKREEATPLLVNYKYRADVVLTDNARLYEKMAGAYALVSMDSREIFPVPVAESAKVQIPAIAPATNTLKSMFGDAVIYSSGSSSEAIGNALMRIYKEESARQQLKKKLEGFSYRFNAEEAAKVLVQVLFP